jgi:hypothetical protein
LKLTFPLFRKATWQCWWPYKGIQRSGWWLSDDDDFPNVIIMTIYAKKAFEDYRKIIKYLDGMRFLVVATKVTRTRIVHKSWNYLIIGDQLYFQRSNGVLRQTIRKGETSHLLYEFHDGFYGGHFVGQITTKKDFVGRLLLAHLFQGGPWLL